MENLIKRYFWVIHVLVIMSASALAARAVVHVVGANVFLKNNDARSPSARRAPVHRPRPIAVASANKDPEVVAKRNIFCSTCVPAPIVEAGAETPSDGTVPLTALPLALLATTLADREALSSATIVNTQSDKSGAYWMNDEIPAAGTVKHIAPTYVAFLNMTSNRMERIDLLGKSAPALVRAAPMAMGPENPEDELAGALDKGVRKIDDTHYEIDRALVNQVLGNPALVARGARIVPSIEGGKPNGFKMYAIRPSSVYYKIGIQNGDTLHAVNGFDMSSPDKALEVYTKVKAASNLSISITRRGKPVNMEYTIK